MTGIPALAAGSTTGLALIVAIGAQNAYVLRQGMLRSHVGSIVAVCIVSDAVLIGAGVLGIGVLVEQAGWALTLIRWLGVAFLVGYGLMALRRAVHPGALEAGTGSHLTRVAAVAQALALTWLNPHVYLDTVVMLGSIANTHGASGRWWFAAGAVLGSVAWFVGLGHGARLLAPLLRKEVAWRILDGGIGVTMLGLAAMLAMH